MEEQLLEELEKLIKENYGDLIVNMAVSVKGSLFLSCWQQTSELTDNAFFMEYLPMFYLIGSVEKESKLILKIISYNGIVIDSLGENGQRITNEETFDFIEKLLRLQLCAGVQASNGMVVNCSSYVIEKLEQNVFVRSRHCNVGLDDGRKVCDACKNLTKEILYEKNVRKPSMEDPNQQSGHYEIKNTEQKSVQTTLYPDGYSLNNIKQEAMDDEFTERREEEMIIADQLMVEEDSTLHSQDYERNQESRNMFHANTSSRSIRPGTKRPRDDGLEFPQVGPFLCDQCGDTFSNAEELHFHLEDKDHKSEETAICFQCGDILGSSDALRRHLWQHQDFRPYKCGQCEYTSTVKEHVYIQHSMYMHGKVGNEDNVKNLNDVMEQINYYEKENNLHLGPPLSSNETRSVKKPKRRKIKSSSLSRLQHICSQSNCNMRYHSYKELKKHYQATGHTAKYVCFLCGEVTPRDGYLRNHIISVHLELKPYKCVHCPFTSALPEKIYNGHYKRMHGNGEVGTKQDVVTIPDVMKVIEDFGERNKDSLAGLSMVPPPLEEWSYKEEHVLEEDSKDSSMQSKKPRKDLEIPQIPIKKENLEGAAKESANPENISSHTARNDSNMKPCMTCDQELNECCETIIEGAKDSNVKSCATCDKGELKECCIMTIKGIKASDKKQLRAIIKECCKMAKKGKKGKLRHQCDTCLVAYDSCEAFESDQNKHKQQMTNQEAVNCPTCAVQVYKVKLNEHYEKDHPELKAGCCLECLVVVVPKIKMQRHFVTIHKPKNLCPICGKYFRVVKDHMAVKHSTTDAKDHICEVCGKKFRHSLLLQSHVAKMHTARKSFPCKFCGQIFKEKCTLTTHYWSMHMKVKPYKCKHCSYEAAQTQRIYEHCRTVHKIKGGKDDVQKLEHVFEKIKQFEIQHGLNRQDLKNIKEFICWLCNEQFRNNHDRTKHELDHLNMYPYECKICLNTFKLKNALKRHYEQVHQDMELTNSPIEMVPHLASLYAKLRKIEGHLVRTYEEYKEINQVVFKDDKALKKIRCKKCDDTTSDNIAEFLDHFHTLHGHEFIQSTSKGNNKNVNESNMAPQETLTCKCCGFETINPDLLMRHVGEVHNLDQHEYDSYVEAPKVEPTQRIFSPRKYRCRYCLEYTAVKKSTVHNHIKSSHNVQNILDHDVLLISESDHLLQQSQR